MRHILVLIILISQSACTLYQSDGREAIEENKLNIVVASGFDAVLNVHFVCVRSLSEPDETKGPVQVIDHEYEGDGYSAYLIPSEPQKKILVYQVPHQELNEPHRYCDLDTQSDFSSIKIHSAIRLGVQLLSEQKELD